MSFKIPRGTFDLSLLQIVGELKTDLLLCPEFHNRINSCNPTESPPEKSGPP